MQAKPKPFIVFDDGLRLLITPDSGWYAVQGLDIRGLNTQGRTIEEAIYMAHDAAQALGEARKAMAKETATKSKAVAKASGKQARKTRRRQPVGAK